MSDFWRSRALNILDWRVSLWSVLSSVFSKEGATLMTAALAGYAATLTEALRLYAPLSYVLVVVVVLLLLVAAQALFAIARAKLQIIKFRAFAMRESRVNPLDDTFRTKRLRLIDLAPPVGLHIRKKTFIDCDIVGPANIFIGPDCTVRECNGEVVDGVMSLNSKQPFNCYFFASCIFQECRFYYITFIVPSGMYEDFTRVGWTGLNWITPTLSPTNEPQLPLSPPNTGSETQP